MTCAHPSHAFGTLLRVKGNPRACLWTEPMWGIPYNLYAPYIALYMVGLGLSTAEIGYVTSISLVMQIISAVLGGPLADKMGRRLCTFVVDVISWTIPTLLWTFSQNYIWFVVAALFNGCWRTTSNSWGLLLTEGSDSELVMRCFSLTQLMGLLAAFFAPLSKLAVDIYGVVPTVRVLYGFACVMMTLKFWILYRVGTETEMGIRRMRETKDQSVWRLVWDLKGVFLRMIREKRMILTIGILASFLVVTTLNSSFLSVYITKQLGIAEGDVSLYTTFRSLIIMGCIFLIVPRIRFSRFKNPMLVAWSVLAASEALLLAAPHGAPVPVLVISVALEAVSMSMLSPLTDSLLFIHADPEERARILGLIYGLMALVAALFPALAGKLSTLSLAAPFWINLIMLAIGAALSVALWDETRKTVPMEEN
jgi:MFS family permease